MPVPTEAMAKEAKRGLEWRAEFNRGGTEVGVARARDIANRKNLSDETIGRMVSYFARHEVDKEGQGFSPNEEGYPSAGRIAWALWGGDAGKSWANSEWEKIQNRGGKMQIQRKNINIGEIELKVSSNGGFSGYASMFGGVDSYNDTIVAGAYSQVIKQIQEGSAYMPKMFINHKSWEIPVGKWTAIEEDSKGLYMEGEFTKGNPQADMIKAAMAHGTVDGLSIGFMIGDYEIVEKGNETLRLIKSIKELPEVSIVTYPADDNARVDLTSVKSTLDNINNIKDLENFLRESGGFSRALAVATASKCKRLFAQGEPEAKTEAVELPKDLKQMIALNLLMARMED